MGPAEQGRIFLCWEDNTEPLPSQTRGPAVGTPCRTTPFAPAAAPRPTNPRPEAREDTKVTVRRGRHRTARTSPHPEERPRCETRGRAAMPGAPRPTLTMTAGGLGLLSCSWYCRLSWARMAKRSASARRFSSDAS